jgi:hypothetical protein
MKKSPQAQEKRKVARTKINIDKALLVKTIETCENGKNYTTQSELFNDVAQMYNNECGSLPKINAQLVYLRVPEFGIVLKTPKGKRGRAAGCRPVALNGTKVTRAEKIEANPEAKKVLDSIRREIKITTKSSHFLALVDKLESGSLTAAIKLKCLDCTNFQKDEVRNCECYSCPLHIIRPYQKNKQEE